VTQAQFVIQGVVARLAGELPDLVLARPPVRYADLSVNGPEELWAARRAAR